MTGYWSVGGWPLPWGCFYAYDKGVGVDTKVFVAVLK